MDSYQRKAILSAIEARRKKTMQERIRNTIDGVQNVMGRMEFSENTDTNSLTGRRRKNIKTNLPIFKTRFGGGR